MVDPDILLIALVETVEGVKDLVGDRGASAILREAGRHSGPRLLESLIGKLPEVLNKENALIRTCLILEELGFAEKVSLEEGKIVLKNDIFTEALREEVSPHSPIVSFLAGLIEGFVGFMSEEKIVLKPISAQKGLVEFTYS